MLHKALLPVLVAVFGFSSAQAGMISGNFSLGSTGLEMSEINAGSYMSTISLEDLDTGVSFDAELTIVGSSELTRTSGGFGVKGNSSDLVNDDETLTFSVGISNIVGGTVEFEGFSSLSVRFADNDEIYFTETGASTPFLTFTGSTQGESEVALTPPLVTGFSVSTDGTFRASMIGLEFSTSSTAVVPEPGSITLFAVAGLAMVRRRQRR